MMHRLQVLAGLALAPWAVRAQPMDAPGGIAVPEPEKVPELPLLPLGLEDWLAQNGGLTRLKFQAQSATAEEIADALGEQTGLDVEITSDMALPVQDPPRYSVEATGQPLWEAMALWKRGSRALGLQESSHRGRWTLSPWNVAREGVGISVGPCFLVANRLSGARAANLSVRGEIVDASNFLSIEVSIRIDPKFAPQVLALAPQMESAVDDKGREVAVANSAQLQWPRDSSSGVHLHLAAPVGDARLLRSVKGVLRLAVRTRGERWEVDVASQAGDGGDVQEKSFQSEGSQVKVRFEGIEAQGENWVARLSFERRTARARRIFKSRDGEWSGELGTVFQGPSSISVLNARGFKMNLLGGPARDSFENGVRKLSLEALVSPAPTPDTAPAKIIVDIPLEWREVQIPFEFKDIPLP